LDVLLLNSFYVFSILIHPTVKQEAWWLFVLLLLINGSWFVATHLHNTYPYWGIRRFRTVAKSVIAALSVHTGLVVVGSYWLPQGVLTTSVLVPIVGKLLLVMLAIRWVGQWWIKRNIAPFDYIVVGGKASNIIAIQQAYQRAYAGKANCLGRFGNQYTGQVPNIGRYNDIFSYLKRSTQVRRVVYVYSQLANQEVQQLMQLCASRFVDFMVIPREADLFNKGIAIEECYDLPIFMSKRNRITYLYNRLLKRVFDIVFSLLVIVFILSWLIPLMTLLIKLESKGPVFFIQQRTGYFNQQFNCIKFRSMELNDRADEQQAVKNDPRITRIGAILRRTSIDEFPQFFNVLFGHMSVVGPRPHPLKQTAQYATLINEFMIRHRVKPGVTGWAQVNGHRGPTDTLEKMRLRVQHDIWYIERWSFWLDVKCVLLTGINFFKKEENAF
jgi:Undecaprenyl-phosphate glucose phosphotransferase